jgi:hypothetical protein
MQEPKPRITMEQLAVAVSGLMPRFEAGRLVYDETGESLTKGRIHQLLSIRTGGRMSQRNYRRLREAIERIRKRQE